MFTNFEEMQKLGKDAAEAAAQSVTTASKGVQTIATEATDFARKSFEQGVGAMERLLGARSVERALEVQTQYAQSAFEGFMAQSAKFGEIYSDIAKQSFKPLEGYLGKGRPAA